MCQELTNLIYPRHFYFHVAFQSLLFFWCSEITQSAHEIIWSLLRILYGLKLHERWWIPEQFIIWERWSSVRYNASLGQQLDSLWNIASFCIISLLCLSGASPKGGCNWEVMTLTEVKIKIHMIWKILMDGWRLQAVILSQGSNDKHISFVVNSEKRNRITALQSVCRPLSFLHIAPFQATVKNACIKQCCDLCYMPPPHHTLAREKPAQVDRPEFSSTVFKCLLNANISKESLE